MGDRGKHRGKMGDRFARKREAGTAILSFELERTRYKNF
jgi:hypothetical protein